MPICGNCNIDFHPNSKRLKIYCTSQCAYLANKQRQKLKYKNNKKTIIEWKQVVRKCSICQKEFYPKVNNQRFCSRICGNKNIDFNYISNNIEKYITTKENVSWLKIRITIFDRDGFTCKYCGRSPMKNENVILHVDHKIPKTNGGTNELSNLITACAECNLGKSDIMLELWKESNEKNRKT